MRYALCLDSDTWMRVFFFCYKEIAYIYPSLNSFTIMICTSNQRKSSTASRY